MLSVILDGLLSQGDSGDLTVTVEGVSPETGSGLFGTCCECCGDSPRMTFCFGGHKMESTFTGVVSAFSQAQFRCILGTVSLDAFHGQ